MTQGLLSLKTIRMLKYEIRVLVKCSLRSLVNTEKVKHYYYYFNRNLFPFEFNLIFILSNEITDTYICRKNKYYYYT